MAQQMTKTGLMILHFFNCLGQSVFVDEAGSQLKTLMVLQAPGLLQVVQLWAVLSQLRRPGQSISNLPEIPYVESWPAWQLMLFVIFFAVAQIEYPYRIYQWLRSRSNMGSEQSPEAPTMT